MSLFGAAEHSSRVTNRRNVDLLCLIIRKIRLISHRSVGSRTGVVLLFIVAYLKIVV